MSVETIRNVEGTPAGIAGFIAEASMITIVEIQINLAKRGIALQLGTTEYVVIPEPKEPSWSE